MFRTLYARLAIVLVALFFLLGCVQLVVTLFATESYLAETNQRLNRDLATNLAREIRFFKDGEFSSEAVERAMHYMMVINPSIEIYLLDVDGAIRAYSAAPEKIKRDAVDLRPIHTFLSRAENFPIRGDDPRHSRRRKTFSATRLEGESGPAGYLYVVLAGEEFDSAAQMVQGSYILRLSLGIGSAGIVLGAVIGLIVFSRMTRPLSKLTAALDSFRASDFREPLMEVGRSEESSDDEIERLRATVERMAERIVRQVQRLEQTDALRRELVANVSHDLRTPLAALQGFLETLSLKQESLSPSQRMEYLEAARRHGARLNSLIDELFELARLEARQEEPAREPFSIVDLAFDVVQKYKMAATEKGIVLDVVSPRNLPLVSAEISMIERVFENLLSNAMQHTPAGGKILLRLEREQNRLLVVIADTGRGIPREDLPHVFDRYYRAESSDASASEGSGLGLAIVRKILQLHGATIEARSTVNVGTEFRFLLDLARS